MRFKLICCAMLVGLGLWLPSSWAVDGNPILSGDISPTIKTPSISDSAYEPSGTGDKTPTLAELRRGTITNKNIGANVDIILDDEDEMLTVRVIICDTTYAISLVPPAGECLCLNGTFLTADYEVDLTKAEDDAFLIIRRYSEAKADYVWSIKETGQGTATNGGASD